MQSVEKSNVWTDVAVRTSSWSSDDNKHVEFFRIHMLLTPLWLIINLNELDNSDNLKDGRPSNELLTYHMTDDKDFTRFEPQTPQYRKLKNRDFTSLNLRITDQNNDVITDGPQVTVVLHIHDRKI